MIWGVRMCLARGRVIQEPRLQIISGSLGQFKTLVCAKMKWANQSKSIGPFETLNPKPLILWMPPDFQAKLPWLLVGAGLPKTRPFIGPFSCFRHQLLCGLMGSTIPLKSCL